MAFKAHFVHLCAICALKAILGPKLFIWGGSGHCSTGRRGGKGGTVNYLQIFKEDICRYLKKISADSRKSAGICWKSICKGICREGYLQEKLRDQRTHLKRSSARGHRADLVWVPSSDLLKFESEFLNIRNPVFDSRFLKTKKFLNIIIGCSFHTVILNL